MNRTEFIYATEAKPVAEPFADMNTNYDYCLLPTAYCPLPSVYYENG